MCTRHLALLSERKGIDDQRLKGVQLRMMDDGCSTHEIEGLR